MIITILDEKSLIDFCFVFLTVSQFHTEVLVAFY